jgi:peroxiredoxin
MMKRVLLLITIALIAASCKDRNKFSIDGVIKGEKKKYIYLDRVDVDTPVLMDSAKISRNGRFHFKIKARQPEFYQIGYSTSDFITLLAVPGEKINLEFEGKDLFSHFKVTGSEGSAKLQMLDRDLADTKRKLDSLSTLYTKASTDPSFDVKGPALEEQFNNLIKDQRKKNIAFILNNINSLVSIKALYQRINADTYVLYDPKDLQFLKIVTDSLTVHYPNSKQVQALARDFSKEMSQLYVSQLEKVAKTATPTKLDPNLNTIDGKRIALSSLRGKYVLLTFWSVRSKECIEENLQLKEYYKLYNKKGFEIYQINLDASDSDWKTAVKFDELPWISTKEDDPKVMANAMIYNVKQVPANYLYDKEGKIIASNLHGKALQIKLDQLFNK